MTSADIILQARSTSTRLPGKIFTELHGKTMIEQILKRLSLVKNLRKLCVATIRRDEKRIVRLGRRFGTEVIWGSEENVLSRYLKAAGVLGSRVIVRTTGDNPFVDYESLDLALDRFDPARCDYMVMDGLPYGAGFEIFSVECLERCGKMARTKAEKEHVTPCIYNHPLKFRIKRLKAPPARNCPGLRVTVDTGDDLKTARKYYNSYFDRKKGIVNLTRLIRHERHRIARS